MRKKILSTVAVALAGIFLFSSCIGPFRLSQKLLEWNQGVSNKFVNALLFIVISPAYGVSLAGDALIFNTIEFWSGDNPIEAGLTKEVEGENGNYTVTTLTNGYNIADEAGREYQFIHDKESNTWSLVVDGQATKLIKLEDENNAIVYLPNGQEKNVNLSHEGVLAFRQSMENAVYFAQK